MTTKVYMDLKEYRDLIALIGIVLGFCVSNTLISAAMLISFITFQTNLKRRLNFIMSAEQDLKDAVDNLVATAKNSFEGISTSLQALIDRLVNLPNADNIEAEAKAISEEAQAIKDSADATTQKIDTIAPVVNTSTGSGDVPTDTSGNG